MNDQYVNPVKELHYILTGNFDYIGIGDTEPDIYRLTSGAVNKIKQLADQVETLEKANAWREQLKEFKEKFGEDMNQHYERDIEFMWQKCERLKDQVETLQETIERQREALENIGEFNDMIPLHTDDEHALHFQKQIEFWVNGALQTQEGD